MKAPFVRTLWSHCPPKPTPLALLSARLRLPSTLTSQRLAREAERGSWEEGEGQPEIHLSQISHKSSGHFTSRWFWLSFQFGFSSSTVRRGSSRFCGPGRKSRLGVLPQRRSSPITRTAVNSIRTGVRTVCQTQTLLISGV